jgi:hypothetical protein
MLLLSAYDSFCYSSFGERLANPVPHKAGGHVGRLVAEELLKTGKHTITALRRAESKAELPEGVKAVTVDYSSEDSLTEALRGHDFLVISLAVTVAYDETEATLYRAAARAGVPYVMPNHYNVDIDNEKLIAEIMPDHPWPWPVRKQLLEGLGLGWTALCCSFWYDFSLSASPFHFGFEMCGRAVAALLNLPILPRDENDTETATLSRWINKPLYVSSWTISQRDMLASVLRVWGDKESDWTIKYQPTEERYREGRKMVAAGGPDAQNGFGMALYARGFYPNGDGNFEAKHGLANEVLSLPKEDLDEHTRSVKHWIDSNWAYVPGG